MSLTKKQQAFVDAYLIDPNGKKAAEAAGYAPKSAAIEATRLLKHAAVAAAIERGQRLLIVRTGITPDMVIAELAKIGFSDIRQVLEWRNREQALFNDRGEPADVPAIEVTIKDSAEIHPDAAAAISEITQTKDGAIKVKLYDKPGALVRIGQHLGMFRPVAQPDDPGKKEQAGANAKTAERGTSWDGLLQ
jgi:phage terminase small subunit